MYAGLFPSPHSGILFLSLSVTFMHDKRNYPVSVPSFGDSFFMLALGYMGAVIWFPSPHSGILFLYLDNCIANVYDGTVSFRPLIRGFFFYIIVSSILIKTNDKVSVPSFGDSFFIMYTDKRCNSRKRFPSPHSGILFLSETTHVSIHNAWEFSFRPLIRGFFFYRCRSAILHGGRVRFSPLIRGFFFYNHD